MANPYNNNQSWAQHPGAFGLPRQQIKEFNFTAMSGNVDDRQDQGQSRNAYGYHPSQLQLPSGSAASSVNFTQPHSRSASFGASAQKASFNSFGASQNSSSLNAMLSSQPAEQLWSDPNSFYGSSAASSSFSGSIFTGATDGSYSSQGTLTQSSPVIPQQSYHSEQTSSTSSDPRAKRARNSQDDAKDDEHDSAGDSKDAKASKSGACNRCKNLKVKCEFKNDTDACKRCMNGSHECFIPGRKKRRTPPKREYLLNQIRAQAAQIKELMSQLEATGGPRHHRPSSVESDTPPLLSPSTSHASFLSAEGPPATPEINSLANKAVEDWIAKAKQSFEEFDVFIGISGAGMPINYLVDEDLENSDPDLEEYVNISENDSSEYGFVVEQADGDDVMSDKGKGKRQDREHVKPANLPREAAPFGLFGDLSIKTKKRAVSVQLEGEEDKAAGIANADFFQSTPVPESMGKSSHWQHPPQILTRGIISTKEAEQLFQIYFERMNLSVSLLDPVLYTAPRTCYRSPFLFTVICAIASRFYTERPGLYSQIMQYAQQAAGMALISGHKNVEMCQAYILMSLYPVPTKRWEDQRGWLYLGLAIRTATDLNLHLPNTAKPLNENHAREMLNRTRVWLNCFNLDRSTGSQYGKPPIISSSDYMANHSEDWWKSSPYNMKNFDIHISAYNAELKVMAGFIAKIYSDPDHPTGLNKEVDFEKIATETDDELKQLEKKWMAILETTDMSDPHNCFRTGLLRLAYPYARLVALSYGFQHAFGKNNTDENPFLMRCLAAAFDVVNPVLNDLCRPNQRIYLRHGPEAQSVFISFASAFLVKLLQPKFASYLTIEKRIEIRETVQKVIDLLGSDEIAIDDRHGPKLYAKFLKGLLAAPMARVDPTSPPSNSRKSSARMGTISHAMDTQSNSESYQPSLGGTSTRAASASVSPAPRQEALSFDSFAPAGALDPYVPYVASNSLSLQLGGGEDGGLDMIADLFQPPLPFDDAIMQNMQSFSDPTTWDNTLSGSSDLNWNMFYQSFDGMDYRQTAGV